MSNSILPVEPEFHLVGQLSSGCFPDQTNAFLTYSIHVGSDWTLVGGSPESGQTQVDYPMENSGGGFDSFIKNFSNHSDERQFIFNHPLDYHYYSRSLIGWPKLLITAYSLDPYGGQQLLGYGHCTIPSTAGSHKLTVDIWTPQGPLSQRLVSYFLGGSATLYKESEAMVYDAIAAKEQRCHIHTKHTGTVFVDVETVLRHWEQYSVQS